MGIFDTIKDAIWGPEEPQKRSATEDPVHDAYLGVDQATTGVVADVATPASDAAMRDIAAAGTQPVSKPVAIQQAQTVDARAPDVAMTDIDVASMLDRAAASRGQDLKWRTSIVDLMKAVGMDASLDERRDLARELDYRGDTSDTATMNIFLHRALMRKLAENGGRVPSELLD